MGDCEDAEKLTHHNKDENVDDRKYEWELLNAYEKYRRKKFI